nr:7401_t:CDS:2 [Entrophospora candida]
MNDDKYCHNRFVLEDEEDNLKLVCGEKIVKEEDNVGGTRGEVVFAVLFLGYI